MKDFFLNTKRLFLANRQMALVYAVCIFLCIALAVVLFKSCSEDGKVVISNSDTASGFSNIQKTESGMIEQGSDKPVTSSAGQSGGSLNVSDNSDESSAVDFGDFFNKNSNSSQTEQPQQSGEQQGDTQQETTQQNTEQQGSSNADTGSSSQGLVVGNDVEGNWGRIQ